MRLLVTIPHFCRRTAGEAGVYGSESGDIAARVRHVSRCIEALHQSFGERQKLFGKEPTDANGPLRIALDVVVVTSGDQHLVEFLTAPLFSHYATDVDPRFLGFVCHALMRERAGQYDYYAFMEDDIEITDPLFFVKLHWFSAQFGYSALLQPNRFERAGDLQIMKLYIDGDTTVPDLPAQYQDVTVRTRLAAEAFGRPFLFQRVNNVHSGCFFLNSAQLARLAASPSFGKPTDVFFGPLESAATLIIMRGFEVYKPAQENAGFLEVRHLGRRFLIQSAAPQ